jgi:DNA-binding PucR family transcriptional regulator
MDYATEDPEFGSLCASLRDARRNLKEVEERARADLLEAENENDKKRAAALRLLLGMEP